MLCYNAPQTSSNCEFSILGYLQGSFQFLFRAFAGIVSRVLVGFHGVSGVWAGAGRNCYAPQWW